MANTVSTSGPFIQISAMDSDYDPGVSLPVHSIKLIPGAANDIIKVFHSVVTGPEACRLFSIDGEPRVEYFDGNVFRPVIDYSECTLSAGHKVVITLDSHRK